MKTPLIAHFPRFRPWALTAAAVGLALAGAGPARGALIVTVESVVVDAGTTGNALDVYLTNTGTSDVTIGGFSFEVTTGSEITFTSATINTVVGPYIFAGHSFFGPVINTSSGQALAASDLHNDVPASGATVGAGATVGLGHLFFDATAAASGIIPVTLSGFPATSLADELGNDVLIDSLVNGTITIRSVTPIIPEPATLGPAALAVAAAGRRLRQKGRRSS
jgi:hypothetical protein